MLNLGRLLNLGRVLESCRALKLNRLLVVFSCLLCLPVLAANLPDYYQEPGFNSFRNVKLGQFGESIDPFNGGLQLHISPIVIPGNGGLDINIQLTYRSISKQNTQIGNDHQSWHSPFGVGWDLHMGRIWPSSSQSCSFDSCAPVLELADGTRRSLVTYTGTDGFDLITTDRWAAKFDAAKNQYIVYSPEGVKYYFSTVGHAIAPGSGFAYSVNKIVDANGNTIVVEYLTDDNHQLVNKVYFLGEEGSGVNLSYEAKGQYYYLQSIAHNSQSWNFTYTPVTQVSIGYYFLTKIDPPEMNTWQLEYLDPSENTNGSNPNLFNLVKMISPTGVTSTYNYVAKIFDDSPQFTPILTMAVATKTVSGSDVTPGTWTYTYEPGDGSTNSVTTITTPAATEKYTYFSAKQAGSGDVWQIGTLQQQQWLSGTTVLKQVDYVWEPEKISDMGVFHRRRTIDNSSVYDADTWIPRLAQRKTSISVNRGTNQFNASFKDYDAFGNAQTIVESGYNQGNASTRTRKFTFDVKSTAWILHLVSSENLLKVDGAITHTYDAAGRLTQDNQFGVITKYSRCDNGEIKTLTNANDHTTNYACDYKNGIPTSEQRVGDLATGNINISRAVDASGRLKSESMIEAYTLTDGRLSTLTTSYTWDAINRLTSISTPEIGDSNIGIAWSKNLFKVFAVGDV